MFTTSVYFIVHVVHRHVHRWSPPPTLNGYNLLKFVFIAFFLEFLIINCLWLMYYDCCHDCCCSMILTTIVISVNTLSVLTGLQMETVFELFSFSSKHLLWRKSYITAQQHGNLISQAVFVFFYLKFLHKDMIHLIKWTDYNFLMFIFYL